MMKKKRILLIYYKLFKPGGVAKVFTNLANALSEEGYHVEILLLMKEMPHFYPLNPEIKVHNIDVFSHWAWRICEFNVKHFRFVPKIRNINEYIHHIGVFLMLKNWIKKNHENYDCIISSWYKLSAFLSLNKKVNYKTIAWEHVSYQTGGILYKDTLRKYYKNLKGIVCINTPAIKHYKQYNKTYYISNIIGEPFENLNNINFEEKENFITFVGRLDKEKNTIELLEIFNGANISEDWKLQIIGEGSERQNLEIFAQENNLKNKVIFHGTKSSNEILQLLKKSKIFGFTSIKEALPTVLIEAMFCGNAIISYNCNYGPSDIVNEKNGFLVDLHDKNAFVEKLEFLANNKIELQNLLKTSFEEAQTWRKKEILEKWQKIL